MSSPYGVRNVETRTDVELVEAAQGGELAAFEELVRRHQSFVYGAAYRVTRHRHLAEDVTQEAFFRAWRKIDGFRGDAQVRSWLYRIATNLALNAVTRTRETPNLDHDPTPDLATPEAAALESQARAALDRAVGQLPGELAKPYRLREFDDHTYEEISVILDIPLNTVRTRIFRARKAVAKTMEDWR